MRTDELRNGAAREIARLYVMSSARLVAPLVGAVMDRCKLLERRYLDCFGIVAGLMAAEDAAEEEAHQDVDAYYAPSECHGDVARASDRARKLILENHGWTREEFDAELQHRLSPRHAYIHALR